MGTCGLINSDDVLASFVAGNFFTLTCVIYFPEHGLTSS